MRWFSDEYKYKPGQTRVYSKFLLFPLKIGEETRWLEWVTIEEIRSPGNVMWYYKRWIDKKDKLEEL